MKNVHEFVVCRDKPAVIEVPDGCVIVCHRDSRLTIHFAEDTKRICELVGQSPDLSLGRSSLSQEICDEQTPDNSASAGHAKWKLPEDREWRVIEYYGRPVRFSRTRFGVMEALILAGDKQLLYSEIEMAGWQEPTDRRTVEATIN